VAGTRVGCASDRMPVLEESARRFAASADNSKDTFPVVLHSDGGLASPTSSPDRTAPVASLGNSGSAYGSAGFPAPVDAP